jgi:hypothetical protein
VITLEVAAESFQPTLRATPLRPLLAVVAGLLLVGTVTSWSGDALPDLVGAIGAGALAAGLALGLDDEANTMLRSSPTGARSRLAQRLALLVPALLAAAVTLVVADRLLLAQRSSLPSPASLAALVVAGVGVEVWWSRRRPETAADGAAVVVMSWVIAPSVVPGIRVIDRLGEAWQTQAPWVLALSVVLVVAGTAGRDA